METQTKQILQELKELRKEVMAIKEHMPDKDMFLSGQEEQIVLASYENEQKGKTLSSAKIRKELGL